MAIEIVDFPIENGGSFHRYVNVYQILTLVTWRNTYLFAGTCSIQVNSAAASDGHSTWVFFPLRKLLNEKRDPKGIKLIYVYIYINIHMYIYICKMIYPIHVLFICHYGAKHPSSNGAFALRGASWTRALLPLCCRVRCQSESTWWLDGYIMDRTMDRLSSIQYHLLVGGLELFIFSYIYIYIYWECHHPNWLSYFSER